MLLDFPVLSSVCHFSYYFRSVTQFILFIDEIFALPFDTDELSRYQFCSDYRATGRKYSIPSPAAVLANQRQPFGPSQFFFEPDTSAPGPHLRNARPSSATSVLRHFSPGNFRRRLCKPSIGGMRLRLRKSQEENPAYLKSSAPSGKSLWNPENL